MSEWRSVSLGENAEITMGQSPDSTAVSGGESGMPFLQGCAEFGARSPRAKLRCNPPLRVGRKGSVLISVRAPVGTTNYADQDYCIGRGLGAVAEKGGVSDSRFLLYAIEQNVDFLHRRSQGSTFAAIGSRELSSLPIPLLNLSQQGRIATILSTLDEVIEATEKLVEKHQQIKAGLMHDLFTRGLWTRPELDRGDHKGLPCEDTAQEGQLRPTAEEAPGLYQDSSLGLIPKAWKEITLDDHVRIIDCKHYTPTFRDEGYIFIRPRNVKLEGLDLESVDFVSEEDFQLLTDVYRPRRGDIVFSRNASFGVPCYVDTDTLFAIGQDVVIMAPKVSNTRFVFAALTSNLITGQIAKVSAGSTFGRINLSEIRKLRVPKPAPDEQDHIAARFDAADSHLRQLQHDLAKLRQQKQGLMHDLLTGRVRVDNLKS